MSSPGGGIPPAAPRVKQPPSCWLLGLLSCLTMFLVVVVSLTFVVVKGLNSRNGRELEHDLGAVMQKASLIGPSSRDMSDIRGALLRYNLKKGEYPESLAQLYPDYLPDKSEMHAPLDADVDPTHVSFVYLRPAANASASFKLLTLTWSFAVRAGDKKTVTKEILSETVDGRQILTQFQDGVQIGSPTIYQPDQSSD